MERIRDTKAQRLGQDGVFGGIARPRRLEPSEQSGRGRGWRAEQGPDIVESLGRGTYCKYNGEPLRIFLHDANLLYDL